MNTPEQRMIEATASIALHRERYHPTQNNHIQFDSQECNFVVWDESDADEVGRYPSYAEACAAMSEYGSYLNGETADVPHAAQARADKVE